MKTNHLNGTKAKQSEQQSEEKNRDVYKNIDLQKQSNTKQRAEPEDKKGCHHCCEKCKSKAEKDLLK